MAEYPWVKGSRASIGNDILTFAHRTSVIRVTAVLTHLTSFHLFHAGDNIGDAVMADGDVTCESLCRECVSCVVTSSLSVPIPESASHWVGFFAHFDLFCTLALGGNIFVLKHGFLNDKVRGHLCPTLTSILTDPATNSNLQVEDRLARYQGQFDELTLFVLWLQSVYHDEDFPKHPPFSVLPMTGMMAPSSR